MTTHKRDNAGIEGKVALRNYYLNLRPPKRILECFAGEHRAMYLRCYAGYDVTSIDLKKIPGVMTMDNRPFIRDHADEYDFFDLDAYGSPHEQLATLFAYRTSSDPFTAVVTDGLKLKTKREYGSHITATTARIPIKMRIPGLSRFQDELIWYTLVTLCNKYQFRISDAKVVRGIRKDMRYYGFVARKCSAGS